MSPLLVASPQCKFQSGPVYPPFHCIFRPPRPILDAARKERETGEKKSFFEPFKKFYGTREYLSPKHFLPMRAPSSFPLCLSESGFFPGTRGRRKGKEGGGRLTLNGSTDRSESRTTDGGRAAEPIKKGRGLRRLFS